MRAGTIPDGPVAREGPERPVQAAPAADGSARPQELRSTPASSLLRGLLNSSEPTRLEFQPQLIHPASEHVHPEDELGCVANWRFVVVVDAVGVHVLDFLPRQRKAAADG